VFSSNVAHLNLHAKLVLEDHLFRLHLDKEGVTFNSYALCEWNLQIAAQGDAFFFAREIGLAAWI